MTYSQNSTSRLSETAKAATRRIFGFYPATDAADAKAFTAGFAMLLASYPEWMIDRAADPVLGIVGRFKFLPRIAEAKEWLDDVHQREEQHRDLLKRFAVPALPAPGSLSELPRISSTRSALCDRYGVTAIPPGWDAVDMAQAAARFGSGLQAQIEKIIAAGGPAPRTAFSRVVETARQAMARESEGS